MDSKLKHRREQALQNIKNAYIDDFTYSELRQVLDLLNEIENKHVQAEYNKEKLSYEDYKK